MVRKNVNIVITGSVDHGKSTLIGRILLDTGSLPDDRLAELKHISKQFGKDTELAFLADQLKEEREKDMTIDTTQVFFKSRKRDYTIIDSPGHLEFLKNMITGASRADAAVLMVDAVEGPKEQTMRHAYVLGMLGIKNVIVCVNKMDAVGYDEKRYEEIKNETGEMLGRLGIKSPLIVPVSSRTGDNVTGRSRRTPWYRGPSLLAGLDGLPAASERTGKGQLRFPVQDVYDIDGKRCAVGCVVSGNVFLRQKVRILPCMTETEIDLILTPGGEKKKATEGQNIGIVLKDGGLAERGRMIISAEDIKRPVKSVRANVFWMSGEGLEEGAELVFRCATQETSCKVESISVRIDPVTLEQDRKGRLSLGLNEAGEVLFTLTDPVVTEDFEEIDMLGRFVIEKEDKVCGAGIIGQGEST